MFKVRQHFRRPEVYARIYIFGWKELSHCHTYQAINLKCGWQTLGHCKKPKLADTMWINSLSIGASGWVSFRYLCLFWVIFHPVRLSARAWPQSDQSSINIAHVVQKSIGQLWCTRSHSMQILRWGLWCLNFKYRNSGLDMKKKHQGRSGWRGCRCQTLLISSSVEKTLKTKSTLEHSISQILHWPESGLNGEDTSYTQC